MSKINHIDSITKQLYASFLLMFFVTPAFAKGEKIEHISVQSMAQNAPTIFGTIIKLIVMVAVVAGVLFLLITGLKMRKEENIGVPLFLCFFASIMLIGFVEVIARIAGTTFL